MGGGRDRGAARDIARDIATDGYGRARPRRGPDGAGDHLVFVYLSFEDPFVSLP